MNYGFVRVGAAVPSLKVANVRYNSEEILEITRKAENMKVEILLFPELSITGYTCADLFSQDLLVEESLNALNDIAFKTKDYSMILIIGLPYIDNATLYNCAAVVQKGKILGIVPKSFIPNYKEFYEKRWFKSGLNIKDRTTRILGQDIPFGTDLIFCDDKNNEFSFGIEICEDLWVPIPPSSNLSLAGANIIFNLSSSNESIGKFEYRKQLVAQQAGRCVCAYVYSSSGINESSTDLVFGGHAIIAENGNILIESDRFKQESTLTIQDVDTLRLYNDRVKNMSFNDGYDGQYRKIYFDFVINAKESLKRYIDKMPFVPSNPQTRDERCKEIFSIQTSALLKRLKHMKTKKTVIGISGGLDSTLALLVLINTYDLLGYDRSDIIAVTMPGFGTSRGTYVNAIELMKSMKVTIKEIDIRESCKRHFLDIEHDINIHDLTFENVQARERTQILMDLATKFSCPVIGTGDMSELALGWCTYNGDHMSMYGVNASIPKTLVKYLVKWTAENLMDVYTKGILLKIVDTPVSPELLPLDSKGEIEQKTEDIVGPYELHDFFMFHMLRYGATPSKILYLAKIAFEGSYDKSVIKKWLRTFYWRFFTQQFKRSCIPDGPKVGSISLSPRGDLRMPSDAEVEIWLNDLEKE